MVGTDHDDRDDDDDECDSDYQKTILTDHPLPSPNQKKTSCHHRLRAAVMLSLISGNPLRSIYSTMLRFRSHNLHWLKQCSFLIIVVLT
jgi:hypothetical protein